MLRVVCQSETLLRRLSFFLSFVGCRVRESRRDFDRENRAKDVKLGVRFCVVMSFNAKEKKFLS